MPQYRDAAGNLIEKVPTQDEYLANTGRPVGSTALVCTECQGNHFYLVHAEQWAGGGYGTMEYRSLTASPYSLRVCLCGALMPPQQTYQAGARSVQSARDQFFQSIIRAQERRLERSADKLGDKIAKSAATKQELEAVKKALEDRIAALEPKTTAAPAVSSVVVNNITTDTPAKTKKTDKKTVKVE
jgi:hypothetical protein